MNVIGSLLLGILQGLTEFLPVSSSGHLVIAQNIIPNFTQPGVLFDVVLHLATTFAVIIFFRQKIKTILLSDKKYLWLLFVGSIPAALFGIFFSDVLEKMFLDVRATAWQLMLTGILCFMIDKFKDREKLLNAKNSFLIGIAQAISIIPGISRSASTIFTGSFLGINKKYVAEYSFLLSIPAILGANLLQFIKYRDSLELLTFEYLVGFIAALIFGYLSIKVVLTTLHKRQFKYFGVYCLTLSFFVLFLI